jgi:hypothetical protein
MPTGAINIQPNRITSKFAIKVLQHLEEAFLVSTFRLNDSGAAQKRRYPAGNIQSFLVLACSRNPQPFPDERPAATKSGMQSKATFILKNNGFLRPQRFEFFLGLWRISSRLRLLPEDKHDRLASIGTRVDASSTVPDELSVLFQTVAVNGLQALDRPNGPGSSRTSEVILPDGVPTGPRFSASSGLGVPAAFLGSGLRPRLYSPPVSSGLCSFESDPGLQKSTRDAVLPVPEAKWLSLCRSRLPALFRPRLIAFLLKPYGGPIGRYSCLPV